MIFQINRSITLGQVSGADTHARPEIDRPQVVRGADDKCGGIIRLDRVEDRHAVLFQSRFDRTHASFRLHHYEQIAAGRVHPRRTRNVRGSNMILRENG